MDQDFREAPRVKRDATAVAAPAVQAVRRIDTPMGYWFDEPRDQHEFVKVRTLWVTVTLSVLVHVAALSLVLEETRLLAPFDEGKQDATDRLQVRLTAPPRPVPVPAPAPAPEPPREVVALPKPARAPKPPASREPPPMIAATAPRPIPAPPLPTPPVPAPPRPPAEGDLWSYLQARRRERGEQTASIDAPNAEPNANLAANLPTAATGVATPDPKRGGGIFEGSVFARPPVQNIEGDVGLHRSEHGGDVAADIDARDGIALPHKRVGAGLARAQGDLALGRPPAHQHGDVFAHGPPTDGN